MLAPYRRSVPSPGAECRQVPAASLRRLRFHDLRHSCDSLLQAQGVPPRVVMDVLGHTTMAMTMERYAKALPEAKQDAARRMDLLISEDP